MCSSDLAMEEYSEDMIKIMEVARRIMKGAKVPASDEKKLMEYSMELYMAAKNMAVLNENKKKEEYDSLWIYGDIAGMCKYNAAGTDRGKCLAILNNACSNCCSGIIASTADYNCRSRKTCLCCDLRKDGTC